MATPWRVFYFLTVNIIQFHPATKILLWLMFAFALQWLQAGSLALISAAAILLLLPGRLPGVLTMVRRARWLLLSMWVIYSFATPGEALLPILGSISPSSQGVLGGLMQAWRLILMLLALGFLLHSCPRNSLLSGLYVLMRPFSVLGLDANRTAVRLWLTLQYAEQQPHRNAREWWNELRSSFDSAPDSASEITLEMPAFTWRDASVLLFAFVLLGLILW